ncbi:hypothetical protein LXA47_13820 [Massilia sp. P8910]|uniref:hypothetical protein n=1 Tax=Massilia antarctica TaxID=2765360 RepID=UPI001E369609|nr:hypothetical protein [Massilia antarctica]MCE3604678.1 hypothetical protein [Massilia antarctica]
MSATASTCAHCGRTYFGHLAQHRCGFEALPSDLVRQIGSYLDLPDARNLAAASVRAHAALHDVRAAEFTLHHNNHAGKHGTGAATAFGEAIASRAMSLHDPHYRNWDALSGEEQRPWLERAINDEGARCSLGATPDFIFHGRIADAFTVSVSDRAPDMVAAAKRAIVQSLIPNTLTKWNTYGKTSIAIANITSFPPQLLNDEVSKIIHGTPLFEKMRASGATNRLFLVRHLSVTEVAG